jgi:hypothetical protein
MAVMEVQRRLPKDLANTEVGKTTVRNVRVDLRQDADGDPTIFVVLILSDPTGSSGTWPVRDLWKLREVVADAITKLEPPVAWVVQFEPEHPGDADDDEEDPHRPTV